MTGDPRITSALGLMEGTHLELPNSVSALAETLQTQSTRDSDVSGADPTIAWSSGQALHREQTSADRILCLLRCNAITVDEEHGVVRAEAGALLVEVEAALRRTGWTLDVSFPTTLRVADALAGGPWTAALRRRLMALTWLSADGQLHSGEAACVRDAPGPRVDRAVPLPRGEAVPCVAAFRARPARGNVRTRWWRVASLERAIALAKDAVREGWPHTLAILEYGRHVALGSAGGRMRPILNASAAALRVKLGGGTGPSTDGVLLGLRVRAEFGVGAVLFATLEKRLGQDAVALPTDDVQPTQWRADLAKSMAAWDLQRHEYWRESTSEALLPRDRGTRATDATGLRCTRATLETHGGWLVRDTDFVLTVPLRHRALPLLRRAPAVTHTTPAVVSDPTHAVGRVRKWRRRADHSAVRLDLSALTTIKLTERGDACVGVAARLADVERRLRDVGCTLGLRTGRLGETRVLDLLLDTPAWRVVACAGAAHGLRLDPMGTVREVRGVDRHGHSGQLDRWLRTDGGQGLHAAPLEVRFRGWRWIKREVIVDWCWTGPVADALRRAHEVSRRSPHLLRLAVHVLADDAGLARTLIRTGGLRPGQRRAVDHVHAVFPGISASQADIWSSAPRVPGPARKLLEQETITGGQEVWVSRFSRGRALYSVFGNDSGANPGRGANSDVFAPPPAPEVVSTDGQRPLDPTPCVEVLLCP